jgi:thiol-disulfide isomerase/thioredoxin
MTLQALTRVALVLSLSTTQVAGADTPPVTLKAGETVPAFAAEAVAGGQRSLDFKKTTVLLFFLSSCSHCHRQIPEWNRMFEKKAAEVEVVGVILDREPPGFFQLTPVSFPVVRAPGGDFRKNFKIARVPMTLRVEPGGRVADVQLGHADPIRLGELFRR